jgi:hypothetical protein
LLQLLVNGAMPANGVPTTNTTMMQNALSGLNTQYQGLGGGELGSVGGDQPPVQQILPLLQALIGAGGGQGGGGNLSLLQTLLTLLQSPGGLA